MELRKIKVLCGQWIFWFVQAPLVHFKLSLTSSLQVDFVKWQLRQVLLWSRDSGNEFCRFSFLEYSKRNDFVPSHTQKKRPEMTVVQCCFLSKHNQEQPKTNQVGVGVRAGWGQEDDVGYSNQKLPMHWTQTNTLIWLALT